MSAFLCLPTRMTADTVRSLVIYERSGDKTTYALPDEPVLTCQNGNLVVTSKGIVVEHPISDIEHADFQNVEVVTAIEQATAATATDCLIQATLDGVRLEGFAPSTPVNVYTATGQSVKSARTDGHGQLSLSLGDLPRGIYIIKANKSTIKINRQ